jgi:DNA repair protein RadC
MNVAAEVLVTKASGMISFANSTDVESSDAFSSGLPANDERDPQQDAARQQRDWSALCAQLLSVAEETVSDEDLLALLLSYFNSTIDSRKLATQLIKRFETFGKAVNARTTQIVGAAEIQPEILGFLRVVRAAGTRLAREEISHRPVLDAWDKLIKYLRTTMAHQMVEQFRVLFLDRRNVLIADEVQHRGTIDHTPVYPREVAKRALELDASAIIMVHNHPSNHPAPSKADIEMTKTIRDSLVRLGIVLHDHIIVSRSGHSSFRAMGML